MHLVTFLPGKLKFKPGEAERNIHIPLINDPSGESRHFNVRLDDVKGRDKIGDNDTCHVTIDNEASKFKFVKNILLKRL